MQNEQNSSRPVQSGTNTVAIGEQDAARLAERTLAEIAAGLDFARMVVLSYTQDDNLLRGIRAVGFDWAELKGVRLALSEFPAADQALRLRRILPLAGTATELPAPFKPHLQGDLVIVPLVNGDRRLGVLLGQMNANKSARTPQWQERAEELSARAALVAEMARLSAAYQDERRLRQATQAIIAAILEGRPLPELAAIITDQIAERLNEERVGLYLLDTNGRYVPAALRNISEEYAEGISRLRRQGPFSARARATHLPYFTPDAQNDPQVTPALRALLERENIRSLLLAMLHYGDRINGALVVYPQGERRFTPREMTLFQALADQATLAVSIAQHLEQQRDTATVEERNRLAREIHDTVAQSLASVLMQIETAETYLAGGDYDTVSTLLGAARSRSREALEDTRRAVQGLAPPSLQQLSLSEALVEEARQFGVEIGIEAQFATTGEEQALSPEQSLTLLRIAQEALNNARKHSQANRVRLGLQYGEDRVVLLVDDDGRGFDATVRTPLDSAGGFGLFGMEERARLLGGEVQIDSVPGWGTRIRASLPYRPAREAAENRPNAVPNRLPYAPAAGQADSPQPIRVLVADDHAIVRQGLRDLLEAEGGVTVVGEAENGAQAAGRAIELRPDVVLMDLQMPESDGLEGLRRLHVEAPELPVIVLSTFETETSLSQALAAGARGYLLKDARPSELVAAIRAVHRGESQFSSSLTDRLISLATGAATSSAPDSRLNDREREVLDLLARGARNKEIASDLFITVSTVEKHIAGLFAKLGVSNRAEAVRVAVERGLILTSGTAARSRRPAN